MAKKKKKSKKKLDARGYSTGADWDDDKGAEMAAAAVPSPPPAPAAALQPDPDEMHACARYGDEEDLTTLKLLLAAGTPVDHVDDIGNTALHKACANGHLAIVLALLEAGASHVPNASGNTPLHWAVQNGHLGVVRALLDASKPGKCADKDGVRRHAIDIDVLARNGFGKSVLSEGFGGSNSDITALLLQHDSCDEERLKGDSVTGPVAGSVVSVPEEAGEATDAARAHGASDSNVVQRATLQFDFDRDEAGADTANSAGESKRVLHIQEVGIDWKGDPFAESSAADEDTTGLSVWSSALVLSRWIAAGSTATPDAAHIFRRARVLELGAGCGLCGLCAAAYSDAAHVTMTEFFSHTLENLRHNASNPMNALRPADECSIDVAPVDWLDNATWPEKGSFDVVCGSGLVYQRGRLTAALVALVDHTLRQLGDSPVAGGDPDSAHPPVFVHASAQNRDGLADFSTLMAARGFAHQEIEPPEAYLASPLVDKSAAFFDIHFSEMHETKILLHVFTRTNQ